MLKHCIYHLLDHILPSTGKSKHDTLRLEHLCALKIMDSESDTAVAIIRNLPPKMFEPVLQAVIYNCYLKYINSLETSTPDYYDYLKGCRYYIPGNYGHSNFELAIWDLQLKEPNIFIKTTY